METSKKFQEGKLTQDTNLSDNEEDLHIVGFKVKVDGEEAYSFALDKAQSKSADVLTISADSKKIFDSHVIEKYPSSGAIRKIFKIPNAEEQIKCQSETMNTGVQFKEESLSVPIIQIFDSYVIEKYPSSGAIRKIFKIPNAEEQIEYHSETMNTGVQFKEESLAVPVIQLKLTSNYKENKELEVHIKSKNDAKDQTPENEGLYYYDTKDQVAGFSSTNPQSSYRIKSPKNCSVVPLKYVTEISTSETQTEHGTESTSMQTACVEVREPRLKQEAATQTDGIRNVSTATEEKNVKPVEIQTDDVKGNHVTIQTEKEAVTGSSQTETAAIYSIDRAYDKSTQTEQTEDTGTSTDFDIYIVDRKNITEKAVDTEDLPFAPLIVAQPEKKDTTDKLTGEGCFCFCGHRNHKRCIYKCCFHREHRSVILRSLTHCPYQQTAPFSSEVPQCSYCHCPSTSYCERTKTCDENFKLDVHQLYCCKCKYTNSGSKSEPHQEIVEKLKTPESMQIDKVDYDSFAVQEKTCDRSRVEIVRNLDEELKNTPIFIAVRVFKPSKVEKVGFLKIPIVFEHYLSSFEFSTYRPFRVVVNPISITLSDNETREAEEHKPNVELQMDENLKKTNKNQLLMFLDGKKRSILLCPAPQPIALANDKHPQVCLCNECYSNVHSAVQKKQFSQQSSVLCSTGKEEGKSTSKDHMRSTTSPKIRHRDFNYTSKDTWKPYDRSDDVLSKKVEATDIIYVGENSSDESFASAEKIGLGDACEVVNDHLLSLRSVDETKVRKAAETLHRHWFDTAGSKYSDLREVRNFIQYFEEYSNNLLKTLLHSVDNNGNNVLHFAFANSRFDLAEEFLKNGLATDLLNKTNKFGNSPLLICSISQPKSNSEWSVVRRTFEMGDVNAMSLKSGQTPLMNAASCGFKAMVDLLLEVGANPNLQDKDGSTALMYAAEHSHENCIKSLVKHRKCDPTIRDKDGQTACSIALNNGHKNIAVLIHMQALEKRRLSKVSYDSKRYVWTSNKTNAYRKKTQFKRPKPRLSDYL